MSDSLISRKELKEILSASKNFESLSTNEQLYIIHEKLKSLEELYEEEKSSLLQDAYVLSNSQREFKNQIVQYCNQNDLVNAYSELLKFFDEDSTHQDKVYITELSELSLEIKKIIALIEQTIDMENVFSSLINHFTVDAMIQFSLYDSKKNTNITLNGNTLIIEKNESEQEIKEQAILKRVKEIIISNREALYKFSRIQEENASIPENDYEDECFGAIDGILFSVCNSYQQQDLNDFYASFKESLYAFIESLEEDATPQQKKMVELLNISLEDVKSNSRMKENAIYYLNANGVSIVIDDNLNYFLTSYSVDSDSLLSIYDSLKKEKVSLEPIVMNTMEEKLDELNNNMLDEINQDYQTDKSIGNVFDLADSLIAAADLDLFWKRVSTDTLGYFMVKELEDNNVLSMEALKKNFTTFTTFQTICTTTELISKNKNIVNIVSMLRQAPDKTLKTIYEVICDNLSIEKVFDDITNFKYTISSNLYYNFEISFPFEVDSVVKNSESSFKIGEVNIMLAKCGAIERIEERAKQWLENSARTNSQTMLKDLDREYYLKGSQTKVLEKQLEKNNRRRVYKFIYLNEAMVIFAYSSLNQDLSEMIDNAITSINILN